MARTPRITAQTLEVLRVLASEPTAEHYGLELGRKANMKSGSLYPILARLEAAGWIRGDWEQIDPSQEGRRPRRNYRVTPDGERAIAEIARHELEVARQWRPILRPT
jgi:DNA-binding PadR family transcriptional regulator